MKMIKNYHYHQYISRQQVFSWIKCLVGYHLNLKFTFTYFISFYFTLFYFVLKYCYAES